MKPDANPVPENFIRIHDRYFKPFIDESLILDRVRDIARQLNHDYADKCPVFLSILNGAFIFTADLFKELTIDCEVSFVRLASYWGTKSTGNVVTLLGLDEDLKGRDVVILEDIIDTGKTLYEFLPELELRQPADIKIAALLVKPDAHKHPVKIDYTGFEIENKFVVGYGLDYDGLGRNLRSIYQEVV